MAGALTIREEVEQRLAILRGERDPWLTGWIDILRLVAPRRWRYLFDDTKKGERQDAEIYNNTGIIAAERVRAGLFAGASSPTAAWFQLGTPDPDMAEYRPVKEFLYQTERRLFDLAEKSRSYDIFKELYHVCPQIGTGAALWVDDPQTVMRGIHLEPGSYYIAVDPNGQPDTVYREFKMAAVNVLRKFGPDAISRTVKRLVDDGRGDSLVRICHAIEPRRIRLAGSLTPKNKPWRSIYWEVESDDRRKILEEGGFNRFTATVPRWSTVGDDSYGYGLGHNVLGDLRSLQVLEERLIEGIEKQVAPPVVGPAALNDKGLDTRPRAVNGIDIPATSQPIQPVYLVAPDLSGIKEQILRYEARVRAGEMEDLFMMFANDDQAQPRTMYEIARRHEERVQILGPALENLHTGLLRQWVDLAYYFLESHGAIGPVPEELKGVEIPVRFISSLAQAQRLVRARPLEGYLQTIGQMAALDPQVLHKTNFDEASDQFADMYAIQPGVQRTDEEVAAIREAEARAKQLAQAAAAAGPALQGAQAAQILSQTPAESPGSIAQSVSNALRGVA